MKKKSARADCQKSVLHSVRNFHAKLTAASSSLVLANMTTTTIYYCQIILYTSLCLAEISATWFRWFYTQYNKLNIKVNCTSWSQQTILAATKEKLVIISSLTVEKSSAKLFSTNWIVIPKNKCVNNRDIYGYLTEPSHAVILTILTHL